MVGTMAKKYPSELNSTTIRVFIGTYQLLADLAAKQGLTIAEALDQSLTDRARQEQVVMSRNQIPMPVFVTKASSAFSLNGNRTISLKLKPRGGKISE